VKHCILLLEDDDFMRENTTEILELSKYEVLAAFGGTEGLELLQTRKPILFYVVY
jgi:CheY-like chemotaxis protein